MRIKQWFCDLFNLKYEIDNLKFRKYLHQYLMANDLIHLETITTNIQAFEHKDKYVLLITTHRPGMYIGRGGKTIDGISKNLNSRFGRKVEIDLKESKLWHNLYKF